MARFGEFRACRANFVPLWPPTTRAGRTLYRIQGGCGASRHNRTPSAAGMEGAGGTEGPDRGARERWQGQTAVPVGGGGAWPVFEPTRNTISTPGTAGVKGAGGSGGPGCGAHGRRLCLAWLRDTSCRRCGGRRIAWPRCRWVAAGPVQATQAPPVWRPPEGLVGLAAVLGGGGGAWPGFETTHPDTHSDTAPPAWRAPEGPAAVPVGGGGAWPGFETTRRAKLAARTTRGRAGHAAAGDQAG